jgi:hypothetical protein
VNLDVLLPRALVHCLFIGLSGHPVNLFREGTG